MAATAARDAKRKPGEIANYKLPASGTIYKGTLVNVYVADGYAYAGRNGTATDKFVGVATETKSGNGVAGDATINVWKSGEFEFTLASAAQTDVGKPVYVSDDQTLTLTSTNAQLVGYIVELTGTNLVRVRIAPQ